MSRRHWRRAVAASATGFPGIMLTLLLVSGVALMFFLRQTDLLNGACDEAGYRGYVAHAHDGIRSRPDAG
jgi:hypothetical protein